MMKLFKLIRNHVRETIILLLLLVSIINFIEIRGTKGNVDYLESELSGLEREVSDLESEVRYLQSNISDLESYAHSH